MIKSKEYSVALAASLYGKSERESNRILTNATALLKRRGVGGMIPSVLSGALHLLQRRQRIEGATVMLARESDGTKYRDRIAADFAALGVTDYQTHIRDDLVGGYIVTANGERRDRSVRRRLTDLFESLTAEKTT